MAFFVVERSALDSSLSIPLSEAYPTREAAIAALSAAAAAGTVALTSELFIADLNGAAPVLIMQAPASASAPEVAAPTPAAEPVSQVRESIGTLDTPAADEAYASWEPLDEVPSELPSLADAIKRATTSLEDEGIVAPDSVDSEAGADAGSAEDVLVEVAAPPAGEEPDTATGVADDGKGTEWPWANVQAYEGPEALGEDESAADSDADAKTGDSSGTAELGELEELEEATLASVDLADVGSGEDVEEAETETVADDAQDVTVEDDAGDVDSGLAAELSALGVSLGESAREEAPIITSAPPEGEDAYVPRPVIMGDYGETGDDREDGESEPALQEASEEDAGTIELESVIVGAESVFSITATSQEDAGYAVTGELNLDEYTCDDCVYSNTCPKVGEATPADCGSFQWKSE